MKINHGSQSRKRSVPLYILILLAFGLCFSAIDKPPLQTKTVLVAVVENGNSLQPETDAVYEQHRQEFLPVLSEMIRVPVADLREKTLADIVDTYIEDYELSSLRKAALAGYDRFVGLTDDMATKGSFVETLAGLKDEGFTIDLILFIHGTKTILHFTNGCYRISDLTAELKSRAISPRAIYQTNCYSKAHLPYWNDIGVQALNGAEGVNSIVVFAAGFFVEEWLSGRSFQDAVMVAQSRELNVLSSMKDKIPVLTELLLQDNLSGSAQTFSGENPALLWKSPLN